MPGANVLAHTTRELCAEIVIVDNGSQDSTLSMLRAEFLWVKVIANAGNVGFARANNQGIAASFGQYVFLLNPDTEVLPGTVSSLVEFAMQHQDAGAIGCQLLNPDSSLQPSGRDFPTWRNLWRDLLPIPAFLRNAIQSRTERRDHTKTAIVDEVSGAAMLLPREHLSQVGGLDESFFFLGEDVDLCWKLRERGWKVYYLPTAQVIHHWGGSRAKSDQEQISLWAQRSLYLLFKKHRTRPEALLVKGLLVPTTLLKIIKGMVLALARGDLSSASKKLATLRAEMHWLWDH